jgi:hypothetical protein
MQKYPHSSQTLAKPEIEHEKELEPEKPKRPLPMWCRGIMGGCVNCGGCI